MYFHTGWSYAKLLRLWRRSSLEEELKATGKLNPAEKEILEKDVGAPVSMDRSFESLEHTQNRRNYYRQGVRDI